MLPLRGILQCSKCQSKMTGSPSKSCTGKKYFYYHCNHCKKERFSPNNEPIKLKVVGKYKYRVKTTIEIIEAEPIDIDF